MATTNIEESALAVLQAQASRASALEAENKALTESLVKADAAKIVAEAFDGINAPKTIARLVEGAKLTEDGKLDADALKAVAEESAAEWRVAQGEGSVRGLGDTSGVSMAQEAAEPTTEDIMSALKEA